MEAMSSEQKNARTYTILASIFVSSLIVTKILESQKKNVEEKRPYRHAMYAEGGLFLAATILSWNSTRSAKRELVSAVEEFNEHSPHKIEPADGASAE